MIAPLSPFDSAAESTIATRPPEANLLPFSTPVGPILLYENFSHCREGDATDWGPNTSIMQGTDRRNWLFSKVPGTHPVGRRLGLPNKFCLECRFSACIPEVTRGVVGWWREPVSTRFSFLNAQGDRYAIAWVINCANDLTRPNPLGSSTLCAKEYYHTVKLPDGTAHEVGLAQPAGMLRIDRDNKTVKVFVNEQAMVLGSMISMDQLVGFEIDLVNDKNGVLFFTDFKIAR